MTIPRDKKTEDQFTAYIDYYLSFPAYLGQYKRSFDVLIQSVYKSGNHVDHLAYPILFLARHCMELGLKTNIRYFSKYSEKDDCVKVGTHNLERLFTAFKDHIKTTIKNLKDKHGIIVGKEDKKGFEELVLEVEKLNNVFHLLDKNSDAFRYPVDKEQNPSFEKGERVNILDVAELLEKSMILFTHTADVFSKYTDYADEIEQYYEDLMREEYRHTLPYQ